MCVCTHQSAAISTQLKLNGILHLCNSPDFKTSSRFSSPHFLAPVVHRDHILREEKSGQERKEVENESKRKALKKEMKVDSKQRETTQNTGEEMSGEKVMERRRYNI